MVEKVDKIWLDGEFVNFEDAKVHVYAHTLHYGLGVFEGIRAYRLADGSSAVFRLPEHMERFYNSCHIIHVEIPYPRETLTEVCLDALRINNMPEGYIRPFMFLGVGEMGLYVAPDHPVSIAVTVWPWGAYLGEDGLKNGIRMKTSSYTRHHVNSMMTKAKVAGNYVNSILAKKEAKVSGYDEALLLDTQGYVAEGSGENIFVVSKGRVKTTPNNSMLPGITRDTAMRILGDKGIPISEERFSRDELYIADEVFLTGTAAEVTPVREIDNRRIGAGRPGPITLDVQSTFFEAVKGKIEDYRHWLTPYGKW